LILLTQGPIPEILAKIAQLLVVVEKLSFFESAILSFFFFKKKLFFFASSLFKLVTTYGIPRMGQNFDYYLDFQQKARGIPEVFKNLLIIFIFPEDYLLQIEIMKYFLANIILC
jgi:hypothetical protein